jgi:nucleolar MIF4G domain-containing protein 1
VVGEGLGSGCGGSRFRSVHSDSTVCGPQLRRDDPSALKDIVQLAQEAYAKQTRTQRQSVDTELPSLSRLQFLMQMIQDLKNNKQKMLEIHELISSTKRVLKNLVQRRKGAQAQLELPVNVSWDDLVRAELLGRRWLVGSSWQSQSHVQRNPSASGNNGEVRSIEPELALDSFDAQLLAVAKQQRLVTDTQRAIFCVIMSSDVSAGFAPFSAHSLWVDNPGH